VTRSKTPAQLDREIAETLAASPSQPPAHFTDKQRYQWFHRKVNAVLHRWLQAVDRYGTEAPQVRALQIQLERLERERDEASAYLARDEDA
jgi:hypothetical protein